MRTILASMLLASALLTRASAPAQTYPGQPTQAKVWVQNRGSSEAVPISLEQYAAEPKLDGWRAIVAVEHGSVTIRTRRGRNITRPAA